MSSCCRNAYSYECWVTPGACQQLVMKSFDTVAAKNHVDLLTRFGVTVLGFAPFSDAHVDGWHGPGGNFMHNFMHSHAPPRHRAGPCQQPDMKKNHVELLSKRMKSFDMVAAKIHVDLLTRFGGRWHGPLGSVYAEFVSTH